METWLVIGAAGNTGRFWMAALGGASYHPVTGVVRPHQLKDFVDLHQMTIDWLEVNGTSRVSTVRNLSFIDSLDTLSPDRRYNVVLAVKSHAIAATVQQLRTDLGSRLNFVIVPTNGLLSEGMVSTLPNMTGVISATLTYPCDAGDKPGLVRVGGGDRGIGLAAVDQRCRGVVARLAADLFERNSWLKAVFYDSWEAMKWTKLLLNIMGNVIPAILDQSLEEVYDERLMCRLELLAIAEIAQLMRLLQIPIVDLPGYPENKIRGLITLARSEYLTTSFLLPSLPSRIFQKTIVPKILVGRGGKLPSLVQVMRERRANGIENLPREALLVAFQAPTHNLFPALSTLATALELRWTGRSSHYEYVDRPAELWAHYQSNLQLARRHGRWWLGLR